MATHSVGLRTRKGNAARNAKRFPKMDECNHCGRRWDDPCDDCSVGADAPVGAPRETLKGYAGIALEWGGEPDLGTIESMKEGLDKAALTPAEVNARVREATSKSSKVEAK